MSYATDHSFDAEEMGLGEWAAVETAETYRCRACGAVGHARVWAWYGYGPADRDDPMDDGDVTCAECRRPLCDADIVDGVGCGGCGCNVAEPGTDYCYSCLVEQELDDVRVMAATDRAIARVDLRGSGAGDFAAFLRDITLLQGVRS